MTQRAVALLLLIIVAAQDGLRADEVAQHDLCVEGLGYLASRETIRFEAASSTLPGRHDALIDDIANLMLQCPNSRLHIEGHTDNRGDPDENLALSTARAQAVGDALATRGIAGDRLRVEGFGGSRPVADNDTRDGRRKNRRIALRFERDAR
ncbi:MAG: OmpA family protein [Pseudomonadota bacterium]